MLAVAMTIGRVGSDERDKFYQAILLKPVLKEIEMDYRHLTKGLEAFKHRRMAVYSSVRPPLLQ